MRLIITVLIIINATSGAHSQPDRFWYFGSNGVGIDWGGCEPEIVEGGILGEEGAITVSSPDGELLFYSNSDFVWDRDHNLMQNGEISNAFFDPLFFIPEVSTVTQIAAAKRPGAGNVYYLFSSDIQNIGAYPLRYITIDMDLNGGLGAVTDITTLGTNPMTEKLCTVPKSVGNGFWFIAHEYLNNKFLVFDIDATGVNPVPQEFELGLPHLASNNSLNTRGELKANIAGNRLAMVQDQLGGAVEIFDFNPATGVISNALAIDEIDHGYGVSFSPNGLLLYVSTWSSSSSAPNFVYQYDLTAGNAAQIGASRITLATASTPNPFGSIKLAPDGNLYAAKPGGNLDRINAPDSPGMACDYQVNAFNLGFGQCLFGLNNIWEIQPGQNQLNIPELETDISSCEPVTIGLEAVDGATYLWNTGATTSSITVSETGVYTLEITEGDCVRTGDVDVVIGQAEIDLGPDISVCEGSSVVLETEDAVGEFLWNTGATTPALTVSEAGTYTLTVTQGACISTDALTVSFLPQPEIFLEPIIAICSGETVTLSPGNPSLDYLWSDGSTEATYTSEVGESIGVTISNGSCSSSATAEIVLLDQGAAPVENISELICDGDTYILTKPAGWDTWSVDGDTLTSGFIMLPPGDYFTQVFNACGSKSYLAQILSEDCSCPIFVPNAFSPNGDGLNDLFRPSVECEREYTLRVYDRLGALIFDSESLGLPAWNGSVMNGGYYAEPGLYIWSLELYEFKGRLFPEEKIGAVTLLR